MIDLINEENSFAYKITGQDQLVLDWHSSQDEALDANSCYAEFVLNVLRQTPFSLFM